jgi:hypothetical protein
MKNFHKMFETTQTGTRRSANIDLRELGALFAHRPNLLPTSKIGLGGGT